MAKKSISKKVASKKAAKTKPVVKKSNKEEIKTKKIVTKSAVKKEKVSKTELKNIKEKKHIEKVAAKKTAAPKVKNKVKVETEALKEHLHPAAENRQKAIEKIKGYSKKDLEHFRTIILAKRDEIIEQLQNLKDQMLDPTTGEYINENSPYSLHMAEQGTDAMEREKTFLYAQRENKFLGYLEDALKRIDAGTYGICVECIDEPQHLCPTCPLIPKARLEAVPHSQLCLPIKQRQEKK